MKEPKLGVRRLAGKTALITGGSAGIGRAVALAFADEGARVAVVGRSERVDVVADEVRALGVEALALRADVTRPDAVDAMVRRVVAQFGGIDLLVNSAGGAPRGFRGAPLWEYEPEEWDEFIAANLTSVFLICRAVLLQGMLARRSGRIINIASAAGRRPSNVAPYGAAKHGVVGLTARLAVELIEHGIEVNAISPTSVNTKLMQHAGTEAERRHWLQPEDIARAALYLAVDAPPHLTGQSIDLFPAGPPRARR